MEVVMGELILPYLIFDNHLGIFPFARLAEASDTISKISAKRGRWQSGDSHISQSYVFLNAYGCQEQCHC
jgi:hypothetical protein